jgi:hypothetical protein
MLLHDDEHRPHVRRHVNLLAISVRLCCVRRSGCRRKGLLEIQIREQILNPCLLVDSGLRHYEIKLDRGFSAETTFSRSSVLQISLWAAD